MDRFEVVIQLAITVVVAGMTGEMLPGRAAEIVSMTTIVASLLLFAWRRRRALKAEPEVEGNPERMEELEYRVAELENSQHRILELEEPLDFAERVLARQRTPEQLPEVR